MIEKILYGKENKEAWDNFLELEKDLNQLEPYYERIKEMLYNEKDYIKMRGYRLITKMSINHKIDEQLKILDKIKPAMLKMCLKETKK